MISIFLFLISMKAQNSQVGDGFGGRLWYKPCNFGAGSYCAFTICGDSAQLYGWGMNLHGEIGNGTLDSTLSRTKTLGMTDVKFFSAGYAMGAIKKDSTGWVWGYNLSNNPITTPVQVLSSVKCVDAGQQSVIFVMNNGTVRCVGNNMTGSFGTGSPNGLYLTNPATMKNISTAVRVANGLYTTIVLLKDGTLWATGGNSMDGLGISSITGVIYSPQQIPNISGIVEIEANVQTNLALDSSGDVYFWGFSHVSNQTLITQSTPLKIQGLSNIVAISGCNDGSHFLALDANHNCYAWGDNQYGQCGVKNGGAWVINPVLVATGVDDIMAGETYSYIVKSDNSTWASGSSNYGSIWMNLSNVSRDTFTKIDPEKLPMYLCAPINTYKTTYREVNICKGDSLKIGTHYYQITGNYFDTLKAYGGTDSIDIIQLKILLPSFNQQLVTLCQGDTLKSGNNSYYISGIYKDTFTNYYGCDSIQTTELKFNSQSLSNQSYSICSGDTLKINTKIYTNEGTYIDTFTNYLGCDSILLINVNILYPSLYQQSFAICPGELLHINNKTYSKAGIYRDTISNYKGCDSLLTTYIIVKPAQRTSQTLWLCIGDTLNINSHQYFNSGTFNDTLKNSNSCDSIITYTIEYNLDPLICQGEIFYIPDAFSPNRDMINDFFSVVGGNLKEIQMQIYNRWGEKLYDTSSKNPKWDGTYKGELCEQGVYLYMLTLKTWNGKIHFFKGTLTLIR